MVIGLGFTEVGEAILVSKARGMLDCGISWEFTQNSQLDSVSYCSYLLIYLSWAYKSLIE